MIRLSTIFAATLAAAFILTTGGVAMALELRSTAFTEGQPIPATYTCDGNDLSPPLAWSGAPAGTKSFALIADDPDAPRGTWVHWVVWNIPATSTGLPENVARKPQLPDGTRQGISDSMSTGYGSPCPPSGTHRYFFKVYALDGFLELPAAATKLQLEAAMKGRVLAEAQLMGTYTRKR